jgi:hypothetical protein
MWGFAAVRARLDTILALINAQSDNRTCLGFVRPPGDQEQQRKEIQTLKNSAKS